MHDPTTDFRIAPGDERAAREIARALADHVADFGPRDERPVSLVVRDGDGKLAGGLNGASHWRWLYIRHFWIAPERRRGGLGQKLLAAAEVEARARDCVGLYLDTFDATAESFYRRCGFARFGVIEGFPPGHVRRFLRKTL